MRRTPRSSGILLHPASLSGPYGIGTLGAPARAVVDFLAAAGQRLWQVLPLGPTGYGDCPYQALSAFAGNPLLIDPDALVEDGLLARRDAAAARIGSAERVDYRRVIRANTRLLERAWACFAADAGPAQRRALERFRAEQAGWIEDFALYRALKQHYGGRAWFRWPEQARNRDADALRRFRERHGPEIACHAFAQYLFARQWTALRRHAGRRGVRFVGDVPLFVALDSADVWARREIFLLDPRGRPRRVSGVPPDYFSRNGQLWGNPLYNWARLAADGFDWWRDRLRLDLGRYAILRIDHFRGFAACWGVPYGRRTARDGRWIPARGRALFRTLEREFGRLPVWAEDLGAITNPVEALRDRFGFLGMRILQYGLAACGPNPYLPDAYPEACVAYTGTHDNATLLGWYRRAPARVRRFARAYLGAASDAITWPAIERMLASRARHVVIPLQDVLELGNRARMNRPGTTQGNWQWRVRDGALTDALAARLHALSTAARRAGG
jgi:4-alpha-glucanotransferase